MIFTNLNSWQYITIFKGIEFSVPTTTVLRPQTRLERYDMFKAFSCRSLPLFKFGARCSCKCNVERVWP